MKKTILMMILFAWPGAAVTGYGRIYVVDQNAPTAADSGPGNTESPFRTISAAAKLAGPGDTVVVHEGIYRERVTPAYGGKEGKPVVYMAARGEKVIIKGSEVWKPVKVVEHDDGTFTGWFDQDLFEGLRINPYKTALKRAPDDKHLTLGQLFAGGELLEEVDKEEDLLAGPGRWMVVEDGEALRVHLKKTANRNKMEITVRERIFAPHKRGLGYIHVKGFVMEHCANQFPSGFWSSDSPQAGALGCRAGNHWLIEGNTVRWAESIGIDCGFEGRVDLEGDQPVPDDCGYHVIRSNTVSDNGCCGIAGMRSTATVMVGNVIERNNVNGHAAPETGGIKVHFFFDGLIAHNLVRDNDAHGIWLDNVYRNARVTRNVVLGNRADGIFVELGRGPVLVDNNIIGLTRPGLYKPDPRGDGLYSHDACGILFAHNLVFGCRNFGCYHRKVTDRGSEVITGIKLKNNILAGNKVGAVNLPFPGPKAEGNLADRNLHLTGTDPVAGFYGGSDASIDFVASHYGGTSDEAIVEACKDILGRTPRKWQAGVKLNMEQWRKVMGSDKHSHLANGMVKLSEELTLKIVIDQEARKKVETGTIPGVYADFYGNEIPRQGALPGPFQKLQDGKNTFELWRPDTIESVRLAAARLAEADDRGQWKEPGP